MTRIIVFILLLLSTQQILAANTYRCPANLPIDALHNRTGWYIGQYAPQLGSYFGTIGNIQTLAIEARRLLDVVNAPHTWAQDASGNGTAVLATSAVNISEPNSSNINAQLSALDTQNIPWLLGTSFQSRWPPLPVSGAMHSLIVQKGYLRSRSGRARRGHAISFAKANFEYRIEGSNDAIVDGTNIGQLVLGNEVLVVEIRTQYLAPTGLGNNDSCNKLIHNTGKGSGFEVQLRPLVFVLGRLHSLISEIPDISGDYMGKIELYHDPLPTYRPLY